MNFENALSIARSSETKSSKDYKKIYRTNWNGKDQYVFFLIKGDTLREAIYNIYGEGKIEEFPEVNDVFAIKTTQETITVGWIPSQTDMLSTDWAVVGEKIPEEEETKEDTNQTGIKETNTAVVIPEEETDSTDTKEDEVTEKEKTDSTDTKEEAKK